MPTLPAVPSPGPDSDPLSRRRALARKMAMDRAAKRGDALAALACCGALLSVVPGGTASYHQLCAALRHIIR